MADLSQIELSGTTYDLKDKPIRDNVKLFTGNEEITTFVKDYYIITSGDTVDINSPVASETGWKYAVIDCAEGDTFTITSPGGTNPRAWCFIDASGNALRKAGGSIACNNDYICAPANTAKLVINAKDDERSFYGRRISDRVHDVEKSVNSRIGRDYINRGPCTFTYSNANERTVYFHGNIFGTIGSTGNGSTNYTYLLNKEGGIYVGAGSSAVSSALTAGDFSPIYFSTNTQALIADISYSGFNVRNNTHTGGNLLVATYNATTGVTLKTLGGSYGLVYNNSKRYVDISVNITAILPEIMTNGNFALLYQSRYPDVTEEWSLDLRLESYTFNSDNTAGTEKKPLAYPEARYVATKSYSVNDIMIIGNDLYIVTASISNGGAITPGTNVERTTLGDLITRILNS